ncbi:hypothetical protein U9M48_043475 [Paspalum notatum var. saurae]|uniref:Uncharacterized protein n=1 Tax=Paspalum notatum var. saurae TaxID=547442 RepID=A0AAQ3UT32_PASNO
MGEAWVCGRAAAAGHESTEVWNVLEALAHNNRRGVLSLHPLASGEEGGHDCIAWRCNGAHCGQAWGDFEEATQKLIQ